MSELPNIPSLKNDEPAIAPRLEKQWEELVLFLKCMDADRQENFIYMATPLLGGLWRGFMVDLPRYEAQIKAASEAS